MADLVNKSFVIWFIDGRYTLAWGIDAEDAKRRYLANWAKSIREVVSTGGYRNPLPTHLFVSCPVVDVEEPTIHQPLAQPTATAPDLAADMAELKAQVAALTAALTKPSSFVTEAE